MRGLAKPAVLIAALAAWPLARGVSKVSSTFWSRAPVATIDLPAPSSGVGREALAPRVPDWLKVNSADGTRPIHRHRRDGVTSYPELPAGATLVAAVDVFVVEAGDAGP